MSVNLPAGLAVALGILVLLPLAAVAVGPALARPVHAYLHSPWHARRLRSRAEAAVVANAAD